MTRINILGVWVDGLDQQAALARLTDLIREGGFHQIVTVNPEFVMRAQQDTIFRNVLNHADLALADGSGIVWAARWLYGPGHVPERIAGVDTVEGLIALAAQHGWRVFFLGAAEGMAEQAAQVLRDRYPTLQLAGTYAGSPSDSEASDIVARVNEGQTDVLLVAYGAPAQDVWIARHRQMLNVRLAMGVGGAFDFIAGETRRAPIWMQRWGLEWLHRLLQQPWRWRRMLALPRFVVRVFWRKWRGPGIISNTEPPHAR